MRNRIATQVRQSTNVCIFCSCNLSRDFLSVTRSQPRPNAITKPRPSIRHYTVSRASSNPGGQAVAESKWDDDDDDGDFPMLKGGAAGSNSSWPAPKTTLDRDAPLTPAPPKPAPSPRVQARDRPEERWEGPRFRTQPTGFYDKARDDTRTRASNTRSSTEARPNGLRIRSQFVGPPSNGQAPRMPFRARDQDFANDKRLPDVDETRPQGGNARFQFNRKSAESNVYHRSFKPSQDVEAPAKATSQPSIKKTSPAPQPKHEEPKIVAYMPANAQEPEERPRETVIKTEARTVSSTATATQAEEVQAPSPPSILESRLSSRRGRFADLPDDDEHDTYGRGNRRSGGRAPDVYLPVEEARYRSKAEYKGRDRSVQLATKPIQVNIDEWEDEEEMERMKRKREREKAKQKKKAATRPVVYLPEYMTVAQLAQAVKVKVDDLIGKLHQEGFEDARYDHLLDAETAAMFADLYGFDPVAAEDTVEDLVARPPAEDPSSLPPRPPIVTIMGHVDHGKTTILDWLRKSSVAAGEHGGITQHIGAFSVTMPGSERQITFLDTPGHEAFLDMRRRGANVTDIVVLVVAADDSVKPQTIEAIKHALEANVQLIVAINKVDKYDADVERVKSDLTKHEIVVEDYGGEYQAIPVSGKTGQGMEALEESIIALADLLDLRAEQDGPAEGSIIESKLTNAGRVATVLVRKGILRVSDFIVAGPTWGRVRTLRNDSGQLVDAAYPGDPVQVDGWRGEDPIAGLEVIQAIDEEHAKSVVALRHEKAIISQAADQMVAINATRTQEAEARQKVLDWEKEQGIKPRKRTHNEGWVEGTESSGPKPVAFIVKADVAGSVEAIVAAVNSIGNHEVQAKVIHSGTGALTESDVRMLAATGETCYAISFNQPVEQAVTQQAFSANIEILNHNIIYRVTEAVKDRVQDALPPLITQKVLGEAEIGLIFDIKLKAKQTMKIAGCKINNGTINKASRVRVSRDGQIIYTGTIKSLKNVKKDVTEMQKGTECGIAFDDFDDLFPGDQVQCFEEIIEKKKLY